MFSSSRFLVSVCLLRVHDHYFTLKEVTRFPLLFVALSSYFHISLSSIETKLRAGWLGLYSRQGQWWDFFLSTTVSRLALRSTQSRIHWVLGLLPGG